MEDLDRWLEKATPSPADFVHGFVSKNLHKSPQAMGPISEELYNAVEKLRTMQSWTLVNAKRRAILKFVAVVSNAQTVLGIDKSDWTGSPALPAQFCADLKALIHNANAEWVVPPRRYLVELIASDKKIGDDMREALIAAAISRPSTK